MYLPRYNNEVLIAHIGVICEVGKIKVLWEGHLGYKGQIRSSQNLKFLHTLTYYHYNCLGDLYIIYAHISQCLIDRCAKGHTPRRYGKVEYLSTIIISICISSLLSKIYTISVIEFPVYIIC